jgi:cardiolipin synthase
MKAAKMNNPQTQYAQEHIYADGESYFSALFSDINQARYSIDLETYIFNRDELGRKIVEALIEACKRGVTVRVLVDGAGSPYWSTNFAKQLENVGAQTRVFHPFPWQLWNLSRSFIKAPFLLKSIYLLLKINSRNHRKVTLIDQETAYIGSFNISISHMMPSSGGLGWHDLGVRISETDLSELTNAFENAWHHRPISERFRDVFKHIRQDPIIRLNYSWLRRRLLYRKLLQKIYLCKRRIWITNAYFVPDNFLLRRLKEAANRGVDVRVLLPKNSDVLMMPWASSTFYYSLLKSGVKIFEYLPSVLHAKSLILDDWALIGSSNLNHRSLLHDLEVDVKIIDPKAQKELENLFHEDLKQSRELSLASWKTHRPFRQRLLGRLVLYIKFWI